MCLLSFFFILKNAFTILPFIKMQNFEIFICDFLRGNDSPRINDLILKYFLYLSLYYLYHCHLLSLDAKHFTQRSIHNFLIDLLLQFSSPEMVVKSGRVLSLLTLLTLCDLDVYWLAKTEVFLNNGTWQMCIFSSLL